MVSNVQSRIAMRVLSFVVCAALAALTVPARAEPSSAPPPSPVSTIGSPAAQDAPAAGEAVKAPAAENRFALGVSFPAGWLVGTFGASVYFGLGKHHALRANFAKYGPERVALVVATGGEFGPTSGSIFDVGASWVWYPRALWDGLTLEAGVLRRERDVTSGGDSASSDPETLTQGTTYAGRAMVGWSWLIKRHVFIAVAAGVSMGIESGREEIRPEREMPMTQAVSRRQVGAETYFRVGIAFGN